MKKESWMAIALVLLLSLLELIDHNLLVNICLIIGVPAFLFLIYYHHQNEKGKW
jgi:hypothetical protein